MPRIYGFLEFISIVNRLFPKSIIEKIFYYAVTIGLGVLFAEVTIFTLFSFNIYSPQHIGPIDITLNELHSSITGTTVGIICQLYAILIFVRVILSVYYKDEEEKDEEELENNIPFAFDGHIQEFLPLGVILDTLRYFKTNPRNKTNILYYDAENGTFSAIGRLLLNVGKYAEVNTKIEALIRQNSVKRSDFKPKYRLNTLSIFSLIQFYGTLQKLCDNDNSWKKAYELTVPNYNELSDQGIADFYYKFLHNYISLDFSEFKKEVNKVYTE